MPDRRPGRRVRAPGAGGDLDRLRGHGAGGGRRPGGDGLDGRGLERPRQLAGPPRRPRCAGHRRPGRQARRDRRARRRRSAGRSPGLAGGRARSTSIAARLRWGPSTDRPRRSPTRRATNGSSATCWRVPRAMEDRPRDACRLACRADPHRLRHGRLAGSRGRRLHVRQRAALRRRRGALRGRARSAGEGRGHRLRPPLRQRALRRRRRRGAAGPRHPGGVRRACRAHPDVELRGRRARRRGRHRHHGQPQPVDGQRFQGQVAERGGGRAGDPVRPRGGHRRERRHAHRDAPVRRRRGGRPGRALRPVPGLRAVPAPHHRPRRAEGGRLSRPGGPHVGRRGGLAQPPPGRRPHPGHGDPPGTQPVLRRRQPGAHPAQHRRGAGHAGRRRLRPGPAARRRCRPGRRGRRARHLHPPARGDRAC